MPLEQRQADASLLLRETQCCLPVALPHRCHAGNLRVSEHHQADREAGKVFLNKASVRGGIKNQALMAARDLTN